MYDESIYMSCCQCGDVFLRQEAVRTPELHGGFCQERCAFDCLRANRFIKLDHSFFLQMNANEGEEETPGIRDGSAKQANDLNVRRRRGGQHE